MNIEISEAFIKLEKGVHAALETYSNVHRGSGHNSIATTYLYEKAREIVLQHSGLNKGKYDVIFCTPRRAEILRVQLDPGCFKYISSKDIGLPLGVRAMVVKRNSLPKGIPFHTGGGTTRLVSPGWIIWAGSPDKFEAGTPSIINIIAFARALQLSFFSGNFTPDNVLSGDQSVQEILYHDELEKYSGIELQSKLRQTQLGRNVLVPSTGGLIHYINLDNAATTLTFMPVWETVCQTWRQPVNIHKLIISEVRSICAGALGAPPGEYDIIFTSNTTEAINLVAESLRNEQIPGYETVILNTLLEHNSNDLPWRVVPNTVLIRLGIDSDGFIDLKELDTILRKYNIGSDNVNRRIRLVAVSGASNVLGTFNDLEEISRIVHHYGARLLVDGAQLVAHRKLNMEKCGIDYLAFSGHKLYAPFGSGVLIIKKGLLNFSASELDLIRSSGEENAVGIAALGKVFLLLQRIGLDLILEEEQVLTRQALHGLSKIKGISIYGIKDADSSRIAQKGGVIVFNLKNIMADKVARKLAERGGIGVRHGCHCSHILVKHILGVGQMLERFQRLFVTILPKVQLPGVVRISLGIGNTSEDVEKFIRVLDTISRQPRIRTKINIRKQMKDFVSTVVQRVYNHN